MELTNTERIALIAIREMVKYRRALAVDYMIHSTLMHCGINNLKGPEYETGLAKTVEMLTELKRKGLAFEVDVMLDGLPDRQYRITQEAKDLIKRYAVPDGVELMTAPVEIPPLDPQKRPKRSINGPLSRRFGVIR